MSDKIDKSQVMKVAVLSRLKMSDQELDIFSEQLSSILEYIEKLNELDTENVEPLAHCLAVHNVLREDMVKPGLSNEEALENAPEKTDEYFKVPKVLDDNEGA